MSFKIPRRNRALYVAVGWYTALNILGLAYYITNNSYDAFVSNPATDTSPIYLLLNLAIYYFLTQPIYILVLILMYDKFKGPGILAAILLTVGLDIQSVPHSVNSVWPGQTTLIPNSTNLAPYADWQLANAMSSHGEIGFLPLLFLYVILPAILELLALIIARPKVFDELVIRA